MSFETVSASQDEYGGVHQDTTTPFVTVWGQVEDLSGTQLYAAEELHSQYTARIRIRFHAGIVPSMVARAFMDQRDRVFDVLSVTDPDGRRFSLDVMCKERFD